jgi:DNA repair exonuclease SbcCD nuclease subunit
LLAAVEFWGVFRFIHAADIHLDSPLRGLSQREGAPEEDIRGASRRALENLVGLCLEENVDFLLIAGDVYDGDWPDFNTGLFFNRQMLRLREAGILVYLISGNHDAQSKITKSLSLPENVQAFPVRKPKSLKHPTLPVTFHGQGFATASVTENLSLSYPEATEGRFNIGLLHCSIGDSPHAAYAPCTVANLLTKHYDYWALGHIHLHAVLHESPHIVYSGNIQGRHAREPGERGCYVIAVNDDLAVESLEFKALDVVRWEQCEVDLGGIEDRNAALRKIRTAVMEVAASASPRLLCVRLTLLGQTPLHSELHVGKEAWRAEVVNVAQEVSDEIWVERIRLRTQSPVDLEQLAGQSDLTAQVVEALCEIDVSEHPNNVMDLLGKLPVSAQGELAQSDHALKENVTALVIDALTSSATHEI